MVSAKAGIEPALADKEFLKGKSKIFLQKSLTSPLKTLYQLTQARCLP